MLNEIIIDGFIYNIQKFGGLIRYWNNIIKNLIIYNSEVKIIGLKSNNNLPLDFVDHYESEYKNQSCLKKIFHSTYYTQPVFKMNQVLTIHDTIYEFYQDSFGNENLVDFIKKKKKCINSAAKIIAISENTKNDILKFYDTKEEKIIVIYHGIDNCFNLKPINYDVFQNVPFFLFVGGRRNYKNFITFLSAYSIGNFYKDFYLFIVGSENFFYDDEKEIINKYKLSEKIKLLGYQTDIQLVNLYSFSALFVYPSLYEGFGLPLIEAMACGSLITCSDISVFREIANEIPFYFNPNDIDSIIYTIKHALNSDSSERRNKGMVYSKKYTWDVSVTKLVSVYETI